MNARLAAIRERAQRRMIEASLAVEARPDASDLLRSWGTAAAIGGPSLCSECRAQQPTDALDGSGRCAECAP
jgi:hypothetical protein